jgi:hypothetical protein
VLRVVKVDALASRRSTAASFQLQTALLGRICAVTVSELLAGRS